MFISSQTHITSNIKKKKIKKKTGQSIYFLILLYTQNNYKKKQQHNKILRSIKKHTHTRWSKVINLTLCKALIHIQKLIHEVFFLLNKRFEFETVYTSLSMIIKNNNKRRT